MGLLRVRCLLGLFKKLGLRNKIGCSRPLKKATAGADLDIIDSRALGITGLGRQNLNQQL